MESDRDGDAGRAETDLSVPGMDCPTCAETVEGALESLDGVSAADARPTAGTVSVTHDPAVDAPALVAAVEGAGYDATAGGDGAGRGGVWTGRRAIKTGVGAVFLGAGLLLEFLLPGGVRLFEAVGRAVLLADALFLGAVAAAGQEILRGATTRRGASRSTSTS